ncbi:MAG: hypothetical protein HOP12_15915 [Candidatus Eisenbacteria bacterium]|uniref:Translation initiation factor eIF-2B n=1 Tax=Eiseniibacteriota bacterium TaxID=2212470 RepID=A0A849SMG6_UNCEI|nr:hypothetical protein [Candidatus Eisenbacteria bacterium]
MSAFADDRHSGSSDVAYELLDALERHATIDASADAAGFRASLLAFLREAQSSQPSMALVHQLAARALEVADTAALRGVRVAEARASLVASCDAEREDLRASTASVVRQAAQLVERRGAFVATLSASASVREALLEAHRNGMAPRALIGEGRPRLEGRHMASALAKAGVPVWLVADAALPLLLSQAAMVWLGADAITEQGVINKIGSFAAALAAREHSVPVYALATRRKFLPAATGALGIAEQSPGEIWESPTPGVEPRNVYFELVPLPLLRGVVVEDAVLGGSETAITARDRPLPEVLARPF